MAKTVFREIERYLSLEHSLVKRDQSIHVPGDERQVVDIVGEWHVNLQINYLEGRDWLCMPDAGIRSLV
jgi:hypothetical protein